MNCNKQIFWKPVASKLLVSKLPYYNEFFQSAKEIKPQIAFALLALFNVFLNKSGAIGKFFLNGKNGICLEIHHNREVQVSVVYNNKIYCCKQNEFINYIPYVFKSDGKHEDGVLLIASLIACEIYYNQDRIIIDNFWKSMNLFKNGITKLNAYEFEQCIIAISKKVYNKVCENQIKPQLLKMGGSNEILTEMKIKSKIFTPQSVDFGEFLILS